LLVIIVCILAGIIVTLLCLGCELFRRRRLTPALAFSDDPVASNGGIMVVGRPVPVDGSEPSGKGPTAGGIPGVHGEATKCQAPMATKEAWGGV